MRIHVDSIGISPGTPLEAEKVGYVLSCIAIIISRYDMTREFQTYFHSSEDFLTCHFLSAPALYRRCGSEAQNSPHGSARKSQH